MIEISDLCDDVLVQIFVLLPSKFVLRCRAVCKRWLRITTDPSFLADHAACRPREMILPHLYQPELKTVVLSPDHAQRRMRSILCDMRCWEEDGELAVADSWFDLLYSLDGLLVLRQDVGLYVICNPITRQWTNLPVLTPEPCYCAWECGFYFHSSSREYRLLCHGIEEEGLQYYYYILSTSGAMPRRLGSAPSDPLIMSSEYEVPVAHRAHLHWLSKHPGATRTGKMLAFDTVSETFRLISRPPERGDIMRSLFDLDGELSVAGMKSCLMSLDIWVLEDYCKVGERWALRHRVKVPSTPMRNLRVQLPVSVSRVISIGDGVILIGDTCCDVGRLYDLKNKTILCRNFQYGSRTPMFLIFSESLVQHAFFESPRCPKLKSVSFSL